ncbi:NlpC/P60 family protein [Sporosarcina luteola]|uniref:C40 family peptidase n=1 Tax=Sporosarcina luteola TaxID=582850 RepID=UPI00203F3288|nr:C40 family peptidase [Sporosarcina luteola]MCM3743943.1 NlpC/P60 family protein [Sporosarcina luteola]
MKRIIFLVFACLLISTSTHDTASASTSNSLVSTAKAYMGTPYKYAGTTTSGFDCSGYTQYVFNKEGVSIPRTTSQQYSTGKSVAKADLQSGDLVFFNTSGAGVSHVGIYIGSSNFIHASTSRGVMISSINDPAYWGKRYIGARRVTDFSAETTIASTPQVNYATRGEVAEILAQELNLSSKASNQGFTDISASHPQHDAIAAVGEAGIFTGNTAGEFMPNNYLTRSELAKVLVGAFDLSLTPGTTPFSDVSTSNWANDYINTLYTNKLTMGYADGTFGTTKKVTSNELLLFIDRLKK